MGQEWNMEWKPETENFISDIKKEGKDDYIERCASIVIFYSEAPILSQIWWKKNVFLSSRKGV